MRYLSLFSGIEACTVAWHHLGWEPVAFAEFDKFPSAVLKHHYPDIINLGDVTTITDDVLRDLGPIDIIVGGSPCQDLSIAGKRAGLADGTRSNLFYEQMRIFNAARHICGSRYLLWENVPGASSSNEGRDFAAVVGQMAGFKCSLPLNGWENTGVALGENGLLEWSVLDAQWFGVPQRRRRVFAFLDSGDWESRAPILFEPESMRGDPAPSREAKQDITGTITAGADRRRGAGISPENIVCMSSGQANAEIDTDLSSSLNCNRDGSPIISQPYNLTFCDSNGQRSDRPNGGLYINKADQANTLTTAESNKTIITHNSAMAFKERAGCEGGGKGFLGKDECAFTLSTMRDQSVFTSMKVRRLTPIECERLQGFPDNYTRIPYNGKTAENCPDGPRYKALGNSMAVPVMRWIGERIEAVK